MYLRGRLLPVIEVRGRRRSSNAIPYIPHLVGGALCERLPLARRGVRAGTSSTSKDPVEPRCLLFYESQFISRDTLGNAENLWHLFRFALLLLLTTLRQWNSGSSRSRFRGYLRRCLSDVRCPADIHPLFVETSQLVSSSFVSPFRASTLWTGKMPGFFESFMNWIRGLFFSKELEITIVGLQNAGARVSVTGCHAVRR